ncbi:alpha/beta hydrolase [Solimonas sp. C16B3]|uniref:Alpha/beta hydrolase n=2 Tax=Solimonas marina TaxID=2714601 RepID=A0A970B345_9GAMM|nr:alpha/beta hydrolase [Solimonas marina]
MAYVEAGAGEVVLFVHGSLCDYRYWTPQIKGLSDRFEVVAPSLAHHWPRLPSSLGMPFSIIQHTEQLAAFIAKLQAPRVHLVGHSRGANVAWQLAIRHADLIDSLTLVDPSGPRQGGDPDEEIDDATVALRQYAVDLIEGGDVDEGLRMFVDSVSRPGFWDRSTPAFRDMARDNALTLGPQIADPLKPLYEIDARGMRRPVLLVDGERSPMRYRRNAEALARWLPNAERYTVRGASHGMTGTHSAVFNRELARFITSVRSTLGEPGAVQRLDE